MNPEARCPGDVLFRDIVRVVAYDSPSGLSTGELWIYAVGGYYPDWQIPLYVTPW